MGIVSLKDYRWDGSKKLELKDAETGAPEFVDKKTLKAQTLENLAEAAALQDKLYAQGREGILIAIRRVTRRARTASSRRYLDS